jgi:hypothetical protein
MTDTLRDSFGNLLDDDDDEPTIDAGLIDDVYDEPDEKLLEQKPRGPKAKAYENKVRGLFQFGFKMTVNHEKTLPDAAAILMYGGDISSATGDLAAENVWVAKAVDFLTEGTDNAALALISISVPFALQILRNHEPDIETAPVRARAIKIPFRKEPIKISFRIKLRRARQFTTPPDTLVEHVFGNGKVIAAMQRQGMKTK